MFLHSTQHTWENLLQQEQQLTLPSQRGVYEFVFFKKMILEKERKGVGGDINLLFHLCAHSLVDPCTCLTGARTCNLGMSEGCSNQ